MFFSTLFPRQAAPRRKVLSRRPRSPRSPRSQPLGTDDPSLSDHIKKMQGFLASQCILLHIFCVWLFSWWPLFPTLSKMFVRSLIISTATPILWSQGTAKPPSTVIQKKMDHRASFPLRHVHGNNKTSSTSHSRWVGVGSHLFTVVGSSLFRYSSDRVCSNTSSHPTPPFQG